MSGPKVVRVVTREELVAAGEALLRRLDAALAEWEKACAATGASADDRKACEDRRNSLERVLRNDKFSEFGIAVTAEIDFLEANASRRRERAAQARAQERARLERGQEVAAVLLRRVSPSAPERADLERAVGGQLDVKELDSVLSRARNALFQPAEIHLNASQQALAVRLAGAERSEDFEDWKQKLTASSPRLEAMFTLITEIELLGDAAAAAAFHEQVLAARALSEEPVREMRLDSLLVALRNAKEDAVALGRLRQRASMLSAELAKIAGTEEAVQALRAAATGSGLEIEAVLETSEKRLRELQAAQAADARRRAVLDGLQKLGYQVHEELSTATTSGGRLVMRSPSSARYGVEVVAGAAMERLQVRTVALDSGRDTSGDIPAEQRWCEDFSAFSDELKKQGCDVVVEKALGVGAVPIKLLTASEEGEVRRGASAPPRQRGSGG